MFGGGLVINTWIRLGLTLSVETLCKLIRGLWNLFKRRKYDGVTPKRFKKIVKDRDNLTIILDDLLKEIRGNRAYVYLFHNGPQYYNGDPYIKMSAIVESVRNAAPIIQSKQNLPVALFPNILEGMLEEHFMTINFNEVPIYYTERLFAKLHGTHYWAGYPIMKHGRYYGIVAVDWTKSEVIDTEARLREELIKTAVLLTPSIVK